MGASLKTSQAKIKKKVAELPSVEQLLKQSKDYCLGRKIESFSNMKLHFIRSVGFGHAQFKVNYGNAV